MDPVFHEDLIAQAEAQEKDGLNDTVADAAEEFARRIQASWFWMEPIPISLHHLAVEALRDKDALGFPCRASNDYGLDLVYHNQGILLGLGIYEDALLHAFTDVRTNTAHFPVWRLRFLFWRADRHRLRKAGDPFPGPGPYTLYRGVAGVGAARR